MQGRRKYLKLAAFVPAIVLVGGFIGYRAGAFELPWVSKPAPPQPEVQPDSATGQPPASEPEPDYMPGSKSLKIGLRRSGPTPPPDPANPPPGATPPSQPASPPPAIFYGSKSAPVFPLPSNPGGQPGTPDKPPVFLGGSKSAPIIPFPPPTPAPQQPAPPNSPKP